MNTKLTLSIDDEIIKKAKEYANHQQRSLSDLVENYLKAIAVYEPTVRYENLELIKNRTPLADSLLGIISDFSEAEIENARAEYLEQKYLK